MNNSRAVDVFDLALYKYRKDKDFRFYVVHSTP